MEETDEPGRSEEVTQAQTYSTPSSAIHTDQIEKKSEVDTEMTGP